MLREESKLIHVKCSIKMRKGTIRQEKERTSAMNRNSYEYNRY